MRKGRIPPRAGLLHKEFRQFLYIYLLIFVLFVFSILQSIFGTINPDEIESVHTAWKILSGEQIYRDFFQHHHPLFYYSLVPFIKVGGETLFSLYLSEGFAFAVFSMIVVVTFFFAEKIYRNRTTSLISVALLLSFPFFIEKGTEIRPDIFQTLFGLASFYFFIVYMSGGTRKYLLLSTLLLSVSFLSLQKTLFLIAFIGVAQLYYVFVGRMKAKDLFLYWAVFLCPVFAYMLFLFATGGLKNYFDFTWLVNIRLLDEFSPLVHFYLHSPKSSKVMSVLSMAVFLPLLIYGCFARFGEYHRLTAFCGAFLLISVFFVKLPYTQYFLIAMPFVAIVAASSLRGLLGNSTIGILLSVLALLTVSYLVKTNVTTNELFGKRQTLPEIEYVLSVLKPGDTYMGYRGNLFGKDADFFWFCTGKGRCLETYRNFRNYDYDPITIIKEKRPKVLFMRGGIFPGMDSEHPPFWILKHYVTSQHRGIYVRKE